MATANIKKFNRHVLKAVHYLSGGKDHCVVPTDLILEQVRFQTRNLVPVANMEDKLQGTFITLSCYGLLKKVGNGYCLGPQYAKPTIGYYRQQMAEEQLKPSPSKVTQQKLGKPDVNLATNENTGMSDFGAVYINAANEINARDLPNARYNLRSNARKMERIKQRAAIMDRNRVQSAAKQDISTTKSITAALPSMVEKITTNAAKEATSTTEYIADQPHEITPDAACTATEQALHSVHSPCEPLQDQNTSLDVGSQPMHDCNTSSLNLNAVLSVTTIDGDTTSLTNSSQASLVTIEDCDDEYY